MGPSNETSRAEAEAAVSEKLGPLQLEKLLDQTPAGIGLLSGPDHRWTYVNERYVHMTGRSSASELLGKTLRESFPELDRQRFHELLDEVYRSGKRYTGSNVKVRLNRAASGQPEEGFYDFIYEPVRNAQGRVDGVLIHGLEVTDRVMARRQAAKAAERLELAQAAAQIGTWEWDPATSANSLSPELHRMFGTDPADPDYTKKWAERIHRSDRELVEHMLAESAQTGLMEFEYRYIHPHLGLRWFYCRGRLMPDEPRLFGIVQDVSERKMAAITSQRLAAIVEWSDDAIISKDLNGIVTSWNPCAERIFGYKAEEMIGQPITRIIPDELQADEVRILATIARGERIDHFETIRRSKSGEQIEVSLTVSPVKDETGRIVGAAKIARDITQRKKAERALRMTERLASVGRLAATVAHEINNPLEAVTNLIFLSRNAADMEEIRKYLASAEEELYRIAHLTRQTLGFYRESNSAASIEVGSLITSLVTVFSSRSRGRRIELRPEILDGTDHLKVPEEIRQVVANLVSNSIDALDGGGQVRIRVSAASQSIDGRRGVRISVADPGSGIPATVRKRLFEPFFTTKKDVGTGLGLWICKSIVENHKGTIRVRSDVTPGKSWTVFSVFVPVEGMPQIEPRTPAMHGALA